MVKVGQVWIDNDARLLGRRRVRIDHIELYKNEKGGGYAYCTVISDYNGPCNRPTRIRLDRFKPTSTGYRLHEEGDNNVHRPK